MAALSFSRVVVLTQLVLDFILPWTLRRHTAAPVVTLILAWVASIVFSIVELLNSTPESRKPRGRAAHHAGIVALWATATGFCFANRRMEVAGGFASTQIVLSLIMFCISSNSEYLKKERKHICLPRHETPQNEVIPKNADEPAQPPRESEDSQNTVSDPIDLSYAQTYSKSGTAEEARGLLSDQH